MAIPIECEPRPERFPCEPPRDTVLNPESLGDHLDRLFRAAWALCGSREEAEDLVQEAYARVLTRPEPAAASRTR